MTTVTRAQQIAAMLQTWVPAIEATTPQRASAGERARQVLIMRYMHDMTLEQIGQALGITRERVRQIENNALQMIRENADLQDKIRDTLAELDAR